eukprot:6207418-Heterocapsa_arctica.AAC.1
MKIFPILDACFCVCFIIDLGLRIFAFKLELFADKLNTLDAGIVILTAVDSFILSRMSDNGNSY